MKSIKRLQQNNNAKTETLFVSLDAKIKVENFVKMKHKFHEKLLLYFAFKPFCVDKKLHSQNFPQKHAKGLITKRKGNCRLFSLIYICLIVVIVLITWEGSEHGYKRLFLGLVLAILHNTNHQPQHRHLVYKSRHEILLLRCRK